VDGVELDPVQEGAVVDGPGVCGSPAEGFEVCFPGAADIVLIDRGEGNQFDRVHLDPAPCDWVTAPRRHLPPAPEPERDGYFARQDVLTQFLAELHLADSTSRPNLEELDLSDNQLQDLPPELGQLTRLLILRLDGNPLREPLASLVPQGIDAVLAYLRSLLHPPHRRRPRSSPAAAASEPPDRVPASGGSDRINAAAPALRPPASHVGPLGDRHGARLRGKDPAGVGRRGEPAPSVASTIAPPAGPAHP